MGDLGSRLRAERERLGLSLDDWSAACGVASSEQLDIEAGRDEPGATYMARGAGLGMDVTFVLSGNTRPRLSGRELQLVEAYRQTDEKGRRSVEATGAIAPQRSGRRQMMKPPPMSVIALMLAISVVRTASASPDLENCRYPNGLAIEPRVCDKLRELDARDKARAAEQARAIAAVEEEKRRAKEAQDASQRREAERMDRVRMAEGEELERKRQEQEASSQRAAAAVAERQRQADALLLEAEKRNVEDARREAAAEAAQRKRCGQDLGQIRVGMTISRVAECVGKPRMVGQATFAGSQVDQYRVGPALIAVREGVIVNWVRP